MAAYNKISCCDQPRNMPRTWSTNKGTNLWSLVVPPQLGLQGSRVIGIRHNKEAIKYLVHGPNRKRARPPAMSDGGFWPACSPALRDKQWEGEKMEEIEGVPFEEIDGGDRARVLGMTGIGAGNGSGDLYSSGGSSSFYSKPTWWWCQGARAARLAPGRRHRRRPGASRAGAISTCKWMESTCTQGIMESILWVWGVGM